MGTLLWNIILALVWVAATGQFTFLNLTAGFILGFVILYFTRPVVGNTRYFSKFRQVVGLILFFLWELILANLRVAYDVITPDFRLRPGIVAVPLDAETDTEITLLSNMIGLTPGTMTVDISGDRRVMYIHAMYIDDLDKVRRDVKDGFERRLLEILR